MSLPEATPLIEILDLNVVFPMEDQTVSAVRDVRFTIPRGRTVGLVGESGCGKSMTGLSLLNLVPTPGRIAGGEIRYYPNPSAPSLKGRGALIPDISPRLSKSTPTDKISPFPLGKGAGGLGNYLDIAKLPPGGEAIRAIRGGEIAMIFQEPMSALTPVYTIGQQIGEMVQLHLKTTKTEAREVAIEMLKRVGIPAPEQRVDEYPHQLSGGMRQRAVIAMALSCNPAMLIADEPTTALDVTVQAQILDLMRELQEQSGMAILIISHDLGVIADLADEVVVMYAGRIVEQGSAEQLFYNPQHPYTQGLLRAAPVLGSRHQGKLYSIPGTVPSLMAMPKGCAFRPRCPERMPCCTEVPQLKPQEPAHQVRCWAREETTG